MKKLNRKGFTLIELLAIIVILAIIMVVTIPNILDMLGSATEKEFKNSANAIEKWVSDQYTLATVGSASTTFSGVCDAGNKLCTCKDVTAGTDDDKCWDEVSGTNKKGVGFKATTTVNGKTYISSTEAQAFLKAAGQKPENYQALIVMVNPSTNRVCVQIKPSTTGDFSGVDTTKYTESNGC